MWRTAERRFVRHLCQRESNSYQKIEAAESRSTLHQLCMMVASCLQKIESRYPRCGLQDIDCDLGCHIYQTAESQWRIVEIQLLASVGWKRVCEPFGCRCSQHVTTCLSKESILAILFRNSKHPLPWDPQHAPPTPHFCIIPKFVVAEENLSHAEKQRVWSQSCGLPKVLCTMYWLCSSVTTADKAFSLHGLETGLWVFQLQMFAPCDDMFVSGSIPAIPFWNSKHPLPTRSLRLLRAAVCSTNSALCLYHAHPFVAAAEKNESHAERSEKQRVWSRSCGLQDLLLTIQWLCPRFGLQGIDCALSCDTWLLQTNEIQWTIVEIDKIEILASVGWKWGCQPFSCPCSLNVMHCRKEICLTCLSKESIPFVKSKPPLPTRSLRSLRAAVCSTNAALCLYHAHPFVAAAEKNESHAEKRVWSRSCGMEDLLQYTDCAFSCAMWLLQTNEQLLRLSF